MPARAAIEAAFSLIQVSAENKSKGLGGKCRW